MKKRLSFIFLYLLFFGGSFAMFFFDDDFYFLKRSAVNSLSQLFRLFMPIRGTFYRPLSSELFYFGIHIIGIYAGKAVVLAIFLAGAYFMYRSLLKLSNSTVATLAVILYTFHFSHVFQLYWFATFQEVALFTLLSASFHFYVNKQRGLAFFLFFLSLFCKEQAILYPFFIFIYELLKNKGERRDYAFSIGAFAASVLMVPLYWSGIRTNVALPEYQIHLSPRLIVNNTFWYSLWSLGFPSMMSDYMTSLVRLPLPQFYRFFRSPVFSAYFFLMLLFNLSLAATAVYVFVIRNYRPGWRKCLLLASGFLLFLAPTLPIFHKWMVRLTLPFIFVSIAEASLLAFLVKPGRGKKILYGLVGLYLVFNYLGVTVHEDVSTYKLETRITKNAATIFNDHKKAIQKEGRVAILDDSGKELSSWAGVEKLKVTFAGQNAASFYFPGKNITLIYIDKNKAPPDGAVTVPASAFFK